MKFRKVTRAAAFALTLPALAFVTTAQASAQQERQEQQRDQARQETQQESHLTAKARETEDLSLFVQALERTGLATVLEQEGPFTVFAPTDDAFREHFSEEELNTLLGEGETSPQPTGAERQPAAGERPAQARDKLAHLLRAHIVTGEVASDRLQNVEQVQNVLGNQLAVSSPSAARAMARTEAETEEAERPERQQGEQREAERRMEPASRTRVEVQVEDAAIVQTDIRASNGILHVIDSVIEPGPMKDQAEQEQSEKRSEPPANDEESETPPPIG